ncbi:hypothetical protein VNO77_18299 [Canavalia gladiata]|uniref:Uncharacterized protein n=1 Tax=Canavalia gladiata TaxID=3824 RepID=A0AAN9QNJ9_CANGL
MHLYLLNLCDRNTTCLNCLSMTMILDSLPPPLSLSIKYEIQKHIRSWLRHCNVLNGSPIFFHSLSLRLHILDNPPRVCGMTLLQDLAAIVFLVGF